MESAKDTYFQTKDFATRAGVTVRALHHYDRLGVLKPARRTRSGYRLYAERDFARLQQIVTLKFIGFSLADIKRLLVRKPLDLKLALGNQLELMRRKRDHIDLAIRAIERAEHVVAASSQPGSDIFVRIIEVINMQSDMKWTEKYYTDDARHKLNEGALSMSPEGIRQAEHDWSALIQEVERAVASGTDPASDKAQQLAARWRSLIQAFTGGNPGIQDGLNKLYADRTNWPESFAMPFSDAACAFIGRAIAVTKAKE